MKGTPWFPSTFLEVWKGGISMSLLGCHIKPLKLEDPPLKIFELPIS